MKNVIIFSTPRKSAMPRKVNFDCFEIRDRVSSYFSYKLRKQCILIEKNSNLTSGLNA